MSTETFSADFDAIVIGGSFAGISASMQLARAHRRVLVVDAGARRNRFCATMHGFLGQDGRSSHEVAAEARAQLLAYPNVQWRKDTVIHAERLENGFVVQGQSGPSVGAQVLVLATGLEDELPEIEGLAERWGCSIFHCPYCHAYELNHGRLGLIAVDAVAQNYAMVLADWGPVILLANGKFEPDEAQREALAKRGITFEPQHVTRIVDTATVELADGRTIVLDAIFSASRVRMASPVAEQLGCVMEQGPIGPYVRTDESMETSVPGIFACGDITRRGRSVPIAVGDGSLAGVAAHQRLIFR